jgi:hypothetical protein
MMEHMREMMDARQKILAEEKTMDAALDISFTGWRIFAGVDRLCPDLDRPGLDKPDWGRSGVFEVGSVEGADAK